MRTLRGYFKIVCCITFWLYQKEYCTHEVYFDNVFCEHTTHLVESLLQEQRRGLNSEVMHCCHCKFEINKFYCFIILSTFLWFHICVLFLDRNFSILLVNILFWSALGPLREDMVSLNTLRSCRYVHLYFF